MLGRLRVEAGGFALLLAVLAPLTVWRAGLETSLWIDESYSLLMTTYPVGELVARTGLDAHPPGYYLALKAWLKGARIAGFEPGLLWARLLDVCLWGGLAAVAWLGGRRLFGRATGTLFAWVVAGGSVAALVARELRGYGMATVFVFGAFLALVAVSDRSWRGPPEAGRRLVWRLWLAYALCATLALWTHLLSAVALAALSLTWLTVSAVRGCLGRGMLAPAAVGHALPVILFMPWLVRVGSQVAAMERSDPQWMTPPTFANLGRVFAFWFPFGRLGEASWGADWLLVLLGLATVVAPVLLALVLLARSRRGSSGGSSRDTGPPLGTAAILGLGGATLFVLAIWLLDRLDLAHTFHGPRYPVLAVHLWSGGLVCLVAWVADRQGARRLWVALALVPWLLASGVGQVLLARQERWGELSELKAAAGGDWPEPGETVYVVPPELIPFYRHTLAPFDTRRIERLPCEEEPGGSAAVLDVNFWGELDRPRDHLVAAVLETRRLGAAVRRTAYPPGQPSHVLYRVEGLDGAILDRLCRLGLAPPLRARMEGSVSEALPEDQRSPSRWSYLEVSPELDLYRWSMALRASVVFDRPLPAGRYTLHLVGFRPARPRPVVPVRLALDRGDWAQEVRLPQGRFELRLEVPWPGGPRPPELVVEHPLWRPAGGDRPALGFLFYGAWLTPLPQHAVGGLAAGVEEQGDGHDHDDTTEDGASRAHDLHSLGHAEGVDGAYHQAEEGDAEEPDGPALPEE